MGTVPRALLCAEGWLGREAFDAILDRCGTSAATRSRYGLDTARSILVGALAYGEGEYPAPAWAAPFRERAAFEERAAFIHWQGWRPEGVPGRAEPAQDGSAPGWPVLAMLAHSVPAPEEQVPGNRKPGCPEVRLGRFVRANWYSAVRQLLLERARILHEAAGARCRGLSFRRSWRALANSGLPEKALACAAGLGWIGRSRLLITGEAGPAVVLGILVSPLEPDVAASLVFAAAIKTPREGFLPPAGLGTIPAQHPYVSAGAPASAPHLHSFTSDSSREVPSPGELCGSCRLCVDACPTGSLGAGGSFDRQRCLQHWASVPGRLPSSIEAAWGDRLYGCDLCTTVCPRRRDRSAGIAGPPGQLGPTLPASFFLSSSHGSITGALAGTALGQAWIPVEALVRNAALAIKAFPPDLH